MGAAWRCPAHPDNKPSLTVTAGEGKVILFCHAGCAVNAVVEALGLGLTDLFDEPRQADDKPQMTATYPYTDESGELLYEVVRFQAMTDVWDKGRLVGVAEPMNPAPPDFIGGKRLSEMLKPAETADEQPDEKDEPAARLHLFGKKEP